MTHTEFEKKMNESMNRIRDLPKPQRESLMRLVDETRRRHDAITHHVEDAKHNLDNWRIMMKYLIFDLEINHRENNL